MSRRRVRISPEAPLRHTPTGQRNTAQGCVPALPWVGSDKHDSALKGRRSPWKHQSSAPSGHNFFGSVTQGRLRCAPPTLGFIPAPRWGAGVQSERALQLSLGIGVPPRWLRAVGELHGLVGQRLQVAGIHPQSCASRSKLERKSFSNDSSSCFGFFPKSCSWRPSFRSSSCWSG